MQKKNIEYYDNDTLLEGFYASKDDNQKKPVVLVVHDWSGRNEFACNKAKELAELGYIGFAVDMYGKGIIAKTKEEKSKRIQPFVTNRNKLVERLMAAFETVTKLPNVDTNKIGIIGFCFGGLCALDLARSGADIKAAVSFHGLLHAPEPGFGAKIKAKILVLHGYDDPMVTGDKVIAFANEMTHQQVDWQLNMYGNTMHAFMNPEAHDPGFGTVYNEQTAKRAWLAMREFFKEVL